MSIERSLMGGIAAVGLFATALGAYEAEQNYEVAQRLHFSAAEPGSPTFLFDESLAESYRERGNVFFLASTLAGAGTIILGAIALSRDPSNL